MGWDVRLCYDMQDDTWGLFVFRRLDDGRRQYAQADKGEMIVTTIEKNAKGFPLLRFPSTGFGGRDIIAGLAAALAQNGYGALDATAQTRAQERHISSLEKHVEQLFTLAMKGAPNA